MFVSNLGQDTGYTASRDFSQSLQTIAAIALLPSKSLPIHLSSYHPKLHSLNAESVVNQISKKTKFKNNTSWIFCLDKHSSLSQLRSHKFWLYLATLESKMTNDTNEIESVVTTFTKRYSPEWFSSRTVFHLFNHWLPIASAQIRSQIRSYEIFGGQNGTNLGFLRVLRFPLPIHIPPTTLFLLIILAQTLQRK
jgi:hypothetical protein